MRQERQLSRLDKKSTPNKLLFKALDVVPMLMQASNSNKCLKIPLVHISQVFLHKSRSRRKIARIESDGVSRSTLKNLPAPVVYIQ